MSADRRPSDRAPRGDAPSRDLAPAWLLSVPVLLCAVLLRLPAAALAADGRPLVAPNEPDDPRAVFAEPWSGLHGIQPQQYPILGEYHLIDALPLSKKIVGDLAGHLPLPIGLSFSYLRQWDRRRLSNIEATIDGQVFHVPSGDVSDVRSAVNSYLGTVDLWLLPFLNVFGIGGFSDGTVRVRVSIPGVLAETSVERRVTATTWGGGGVVGFAWHDFFMLVTTTYTSSNVSLVDNHVQTFLVSPRVGYVHETGPLRASLLVGPNYYQNSSLHRGRIRVRNLDISYRADVEEVDPWNAAIGTHFSLWKRLDVLVSGSVGTRSALLATASVRF